MVHEEDKPKDEDAWMLEDTEDMVPPSDSPQWQAGLIAGGVATYFLRRRFDSLPIWQTLPLCWLIGAVGVFCIKRTCFDPEDPPSAAEKKRHLFGDSWAAFCAGIACVTTAFLTALFTLCALVGLKLWWYWVLLYFGFFCGLPLIFVRF